MWLRAVVVVFVAAALQFYVLMQKLPPETYMSIQKMCEKQGYNATEHTITTQDGYILSIFRIFKKQPKGHPVLLLHSLGGAAESFIINLSSHPLGYKLIDAGYDVWLLNNRGNIYSQGHLKLSPSSKEFWDFDCGEMAKYDLDSSINYIKKLTKQPKLALIGHSQGGSMILGALALNPDYEDNISIAISIAGTAGTLSKPSFRIKIITSKVLQKILKLFNVYTIFGTRSEFTGKLYTAFPWLGAFAFNDRFDVYLNNDEVKNLGYYAIKTSGGTSVRNLEFFSGFSNKLERFRMPDKGPERNMKVYGNETAPYVDYSKVKPKTAVFGGLHDQIIRVEDVQNLYEQLPKDRVLFYKGDYHLDHNGFLLSHNDVYIADLISVLNKASKA
jgi:lysosomal acid lipase/cholesteryl ester hydrolase